MSPDYTWHEKVLASPGERIPVHEGDPQPGWYVVRLNDDEPFAPASIHYDGDELKAEIGGEPCCPYEWWLTFACRPIPREEYHILLSQALSGNYIGPTRPRARWCDPAEIAKDFLNYDLSKQEANNAK